MLYVNANEDNNSTLSSARFNFIFIQFIKLLRPVGILFLFFVVLFTTPISLRLKIFFVACEMSQINNKWKQKQKIGNFKEKYVYTKQAGGVEKIKRSFFSSFAA